MLLVEVPRVELSFSCKAALGGKQSIFGKTAWGPFSAAEVEEGVAPSIRLRDLSVSQIEMFALRWIWI